MTAGKFAVTDFFDGNIYRQRSADDVSQLEYVWRRLVRLDHGQARLDLGRSARTQSEILGLSRRLFPGAGRLQRQQFRHPHSGARRIHRRELELRYSLFSQPGKLRLIGWANHRPIWGAMQRPLRMPVTTPNYPDITLTRHVRDELRLRRQLRAGDHGRSRTVLACELESRAAEIIGWTDCDKSLSFGAVLKGNAWGRPDDKIGMAGVVEGLSPEARAYFAAGGPRHSDRRRPAQLSPRKRSSKPITPTASTNGQRSPSIISSSPIPATTPTADRFRSSRHDCTRNSSRRP